MVLVDVVMLAYNHESYIIQGIESVLMQKTSFSIRLNIFNDKSTDKTHKKITEIINSHPNSKLIRYFNHSENLGMMGNCIFALNHCDAKYIATCEGDDYWLDPKKLQKQVDFLENNENFSICFHRAKIIYENGIAPFYVDINKNTPEITTIDDLLDGNFIHTPTIVFRNIETLPDWFATAYPGDWPLNIISATNGKIKFFNEAMSVYRIHSGGIHSTRKIPIEKGLATIKNIAGDLQQKGFNRQAKKIMRHYNNNYAILYGLANIKMNRFKRSLIILSKGTLKLKCLFMLPIIFGNKSVEIWKYLSEKRSTK